ncbi:MAG: hypothetical protein BA861_06130 [Desulfobacterales bacterium S3730MH5]|nr:MAG: hypothetical protein BA861_06130 [Desulfobacterales bacterium S3730MH5]
MLLFTDIRSPGFSKLFRNKSIVDYIVGKTVGKLVAGKTPGEIAEIKILDPACGSGSFLIGAYTYLLKYHLDWYMENKPRKHKKAVFQVRENEKVSDDG